MKNQPQLADLITERDDPILAHLENISYAYLSDPLDHGFILSFTFGANAFFENKVLTKTYHLLNPPDAFGDIMFESSEGCVIEWAKGKDVTTTIESKKQRHKGTNKTRVVKKTVKCESFFNFFSPPQVDEDGEDEEVDDMEDQVEADYEIGEIIKEKICVNACDWFTGIHFMYHF